MVAKSLVIQICYLSNYDVSRSHTTTQHSR